MRRVSGGLLRGRRLDELPPQSSNVRPTSARVRQAIFDHLQDQVEDTTVLDLFAGTGALGIEALSRGARFVTLVEIQPSIARFLKLQCKKLNLQEKSQVWQGDAQQFLQKSPESVRQAHHLVFLDPPYLDRNQTYHHPWMKSIFMQLTQGWLLDQAIVVYEFSTHSQDETIPVWTEEYQPITHKIYGQTSLVFLRWSEPGKAESSHAKQNLIE